jgi:hypothetical protein
MPDLPPNIADSPANPLQPGDPFKRGNFNRFALGMCLFMALFLIAAIILFYASRKHQPGPTPAAPARSALQLQGPATA